MRYRLKQRLPGHPEVGTIIDCDDYMYNGIVICAKDFPEFWEKVVEKDYEILSFIVNKNYNKLNKGEILYRKEGGIFEGFSNDGTNSKIWSKSDTDLLKLPHWSIYSVKRLSDDEVFTIGDKITSYKTTKTITKINIPRSNPNDVGFTTYSEKYTNSTGYQYLFEDKVEKVKKPLFTTEDGVELFSTEDRIYEVTPLFANILNRSAGLGPQYSNTKIFSTKEAAEDYVLMNKPCLSINDVVNSTCFEFQTVIDELQRKVKSKL